MEILIMRCKCKKPVNVFNGICGGCLMALRGTVHAEDGKLIKYRKPKGKKRVKSSEIEHIIFELERFRRLNDADIHLVLEILKRE
jgi:hypothetical protein